MIAAGIIVPVNAATAQPLTIQPQTLPAHQSRTAAAVWATPSALPLFMAPMVLPPASGPDGIKSGIRGVSSMQTRHLTDLSALSWNPPNGNVVLTGQLLNVHGVGRDLTLAWWYNSLNDTRPTLSVGGVEAAISVATDNSVTYTAPDGGTYKFAAAGSGQWSMPPGLNATITAFSSTAVTIRFNDTGYSNEYQYDGTNFVLKYANDQNATAPNRITYTYDTAGLLTTIDDTVGNRPVKFRYNDSRNPEQPSRIIDDSLSRTIDVEYGGPNGAMSKIIDATGAEMSFGYGTPSNRVTTVTDGRGTVTTLAYDSTKRLTKATYATGKPVQSIYQYAYLNNATDGNFSRVTDPNGNDTDFLVNAARPNQVTQVRGPLGTNSAATADAHDNRTKVSNALGNSTTYAYNVNNSLTKLTASAGAAGGTGGDISFTYPSSSGNPLANYQPSTTISTEGKTTSFSYDANTNNRSQTQTPSGVGGTPKLNYQGDAAGTNCGAKKGELCKSTDGKGNVTTYAYDSMGNPSVITRPAPLGAISNTYDDASRLISSTDGKGQTALYDYDDNDRLHQIDYGNDCATKCVTYYYDEVGNLIEREDDTGVTSYNYDAQNRLKSKDDINGVTTSVTYDGASNVLSYNDPTGTVTYTYDAANRLVSLAEPGGSCPTTPVFPNATKCTGFQYNTASQQTAVKYPNGVTNSTVYDGATRVKSITATNSSNAVLAKRAYTYTTVGTKDGALRKTMTTDTGSVSTYGYDPMNRLTSTVTGTVTEGGTYDANANRTSATKTGAATVRAAFNAADQLCWTSTSTGSCATAPSGATTYGYDANGNTTTAGTTTSTFNVFDQFTANTTAGTTTAFTYTGPRNDERLTAGATSFLNGTLGITQQTTGGTTTSFIRDPAGNLISMRTSAGTFYYTTDALGSTILLTDSTQAKAAVYGYDSWGNTTSTGTQAANNPWQYAGGYKDAATGYTKFGARYYNPAIGRFTQTDPSGQEANRYAYASCNPVNVTDPTGLDVACGISTGLVAGVQGIIWGVAIGTVAEPGVGSLVGGLIGLGLGVAGAIACG